MSPALRILFMGSPEQAVPCLNQLANSNHQIVGVVTRPDRGQGRGRKVQPCAIAARARELDLPLFQPESLVNPPFIDIIQALKPDIGIVVAYGKILKDDILNAPKHGCWNVHFSLLPKYRGAAPYQWALINGESQTGVSIIRLVKELDAGPIITQSTREIAADETAASLGEKLAQDGAQLLTTAINQLIANAVTPIEQNHDQATFAPMLKKTDGHLTWSKPALTLTQQIRGLNPWPGAYCFVPGTAGSIDKARLKIYSATTSANDHKASPGTIIEATSKNGIIVACQDGSLQLQEVQLEGKKRMSASQLLQGYKLPEGTQLV